MIDSILCYLWLARHGCNVSGINLFALFSVTGQFHYRFPFTIETANLEIYNDAFIPELLVAAWHRKDWGAAKKYSSFDSATVVTEKMLDDIPF